MSTTLFWVPVVSPKENRLSDQLKYALRKRYCDKFINEVLDSSCIEYLC